MKTTTSYYGTATATPAYSDGDIGRITNNLLVANLDWGLQEVNQSLRYLTTKYYFNERSYTTTSVGGQQFYNLPPQVKKLINLTVFIGSTLWQPKECPSREYWDYLNTQTFNQDYPSFFFVFNGQVGLWPVPASDGNTITMNYKIRTVDLSMPDVTNVTSGTTVAIQQDNPQLNASGDMFKDWMVDQWVRIPHSTNDTINGDNQWYQISSIVDSTQAILKNSYSGKSIAEGAAFTIGEVPLLPEDYQDLPLYRMGMIYYGTRFPDKTRYDLYENLYNTGFAALDEEFGSKTTSIILPDTSAPIYNPNLFTSNLTGN